MALLQSEIGGRQTPLLPAFRLCARQTAGEAKRFFEQLCRLLEQGDWGLTEEDAGILTALGPTLGRYDGQTQAQALERQRKKLEQNMARAREEQESQGRLWRTAGLCCGAALALLAV